MKTLERRLGLSAVIAINMGAMIGGLFVLPGLATAMTGPSVWLAFLVALICVLPAVFSKAELATAMPTSGGTYVYIDRAFGPLAGTIAGIGLWFSLLLKSAFGLVGFGAYLSVLSDRWLPFPVSLKATSLALLLFIMVINIFGVKKVGKVQVVLVVIALFWLLWAIVQGSATFDSMLLEPSFSAGQSGFLEAVAFLYISYAGVTKVAAVAEEVRDPGRTLPQGMIISVLVVGTLYVVVSLVLVGNVPAAELHTDLRPLHTLALQISGPVGGTVAAIVGILTMISMANAGLLAASRFPFAMSRDRLLPDWVGWVSPRYLTPVVCIMLTSLVMGVAIMTLDVAKIAKLAASFKITAFILVNLCVLVLRENHVQWYKPAFRVPLYPGLPILGVVLGIGLLWMLGTIGAIALAAMIMPGTLFFFVYGRGRVDRRSVFGRLGPRMELLETVQGPESLESSLPEEAAVVLPLIGHERSPEALVEMGAALAGGRKVEVLHISELPEQVNLDSLLEEDPQITSLRRRVDAVAQVRAFDVDFDATVTRDMLKTIHDVSARVHCEWVLLEWEERRRDRFTPFTPLGWLVNHLSANLALFKDAGVRYIREIMAVPVPDAQSALVAETADHLAGVLGAQLTLVRFVPDGDDDATVGRVMDSLDALAANCDSDVSTLVVRGKESVESLRQLTSAYDLLVIGAPERSVHGQLFGTAGDRLTAKAACSVLRLKVPRAPD
jgi:amino acid transporter